MIKIMLSIVFFQLALPALRQFIQPIRDDGPVSHQQKRVPTMGGIAIMIAFLLQFYAAGITMVHPYIQLMVGLGGLGLYDDIKKLYYNNSRGLSAKWKFLLQCGISFGVLYQLPLDSQVAVGGWVLDLGWFYPIFAMLVIVSSSNAFNLTDGLDGLATSQALILFIFLGAIGVAVSQGMVVATCEAIMVALLGFLWINRHPAKAFMGDVGSLPIGGLMGLMAVVLKVELLFAVIASVLVWETVSVIIQVVWFKRGRGRFFKMAPYHHHLEIIGWSEVRIVWLFAGVTTLLVLAIGRLGIS